MSIFKGFFSALLGVSMVAAVSSGANAVLINFGNETGPETAYSENGFTLTATFGDVELGGFAFPSTDSEIKPNLLFNNAGLILTRNGGAEFDLNSFVIEVDDLNNPGPLDFDFTIQGTRADSSSETTTLADLTAATSVGAELSAFTNLVTVTFTATSFFVVIDDIDVTASNGNQNGDVNVPEPGTLALLGVGLLGIAAIRRRRSV